MLNAPHKILRTVPRWILALCTFAFLAGCSPQPSTPEPPPESSPQETAASTEHLRPAVHLTPAENWMNDPNGMVYVGGKYHVFYQYNPEGNEWGNMSWGHQVSTDLVNWEEQPVAMAATETEEIFSGSVVMDYDNTSGLGTADNPPMVALYTSAYKQDSGREGIQAQSLAYSLDEGASWQKLEDNPVLTLEPESPHFRDPKVTWYEPGGYWVMTTVVADAQVVKIYKSDNLRDWEFLSDFSGAGAQNGLWEMPELIEMPVEDQPSHTKWVMLLSVNPGGIAGGSGNQYFVGEFDGTRFTPDTVTPADADPTEHNWLDYGADYYAATSISGAPGAKPVLVGWMSNWDYAADIPTAPWRGSMAVPRELTLAEVDGKLRLRTTIASEAAETLVRDSDARTVTLEPQSDVLAAGTDFNLAAQLLDVTITPTSAAEAGVLLKIDKNGSGGVAISYDTTSQTLAVDRSESGNTAFSEKFSTYHPVTLPLREGKLNLRVLIDRGSVEVFAEDGRIVITDLVFPEGDHLDTAVFAENGSAHVSLTSHPLAD